MTFRVPAAMPSSMALSILSSLKPSFLRPAPTAKRRQLHRTSYLDGLRGVAALFVVFAHYEATYFPSLNLAWHAGCVVGVESGECQQESSVLQLPIVRGLYKGPFMVAIFFVISGHVLSQKALGLARKGEHAELLRSLASSVFRRWFRLMLPAVASSPLFFLLARCGWATELAAGWDLNHAPVSGPLFSSEDLSLSTWTAEILHLTNPFRFGDIKFPLYNYPLWTMPVEYMGSMVVFVVIIGTSLLRPALRLTAVTVLCLYSLWLAPWKWGLFISGVLLADMCDHSATDAAPISVLSFASTIDEEGAVKNDRQTSYLESWAGYFKPFSITNPRLSYMPDLFLFILALYLGSAPSGDPAELAAAPGYSWLSPWIPRSWGMSMGYFYPDIGAILLVFVLTRAEFLQRIFTTSIAQYLGDISLSLYMLHVVMLHTLGNWLIVHCSAATRPLGARGFTVGIWGMFCLSLPSGPN